MNEGAAMTSRDEERSSVWMAAADAFSRWRDGDSAALDDLVRLLTPVLWHVVRAYGLDQHRAEDVVQSTWMTLVHKRDSIVEPRAVGSWLTTTARREAWRSSQAAGRLTVVDDEVLERRGGTVPGADSQVVAADEATRLWDQVGQLSPRCQRLLRVIAFSDRPDYRQIATDLQMPVGSIGPTRGRCLARLKDLMTTTATGEAP
ncbi:MAG: sigma-70 family RNA polymerase sigma factor [Actinomycetota bacterium]|nr:sigma-70 family RNA polymerase sigma factor [Actinomycetota bacterium]